MRRGPVTLLYKRVIIISAENLLQGNTVQLTAAAIGALPSASFSSYLRIRLCIYALGLCGVVLKSYAALHT